MLVYLPLIAAGSSAVTSVPADWFCASQAVMPTKALIPMLCPGSLYAEILKCSSLTTSQCKADSTCTWSFYLNSKNESVYQANMNASFGYLNL